MIPFEPCRLCEDSKATIPGYLECVVDGVIHYMECACHIKWRKQNLYMDRARKAGLFTITNATQSENAIYSSLANYDPDKDYKGVDSLESVHKLKMLIKHFDKYDINSSIFYMYGSAGTQKTSLAKWTGLSLIKKGFSVKYLRMNNLIESLMPNYENPLSPEVIEQFYNTDLLIVDESFMKGQVTIWKSGHQLPILSNFIRERIEDYKKAILFVANIPPNQIATEGWTATIQNFIEREVGIRNTLLTFSDNYWENYSSLTKSGVIEVKDVFKGKS